MNKIKISAVSYLNTTPFIYGIEKSGLINTIDLSLDMPAVCAEKLLTDNVDIGLIPIAVLPQLKFYQIIGDYCIGAEGAVNSVMLYSRVPLKKIETILLDYQSKTSVTLVKVLAEKYWKINPEWIQADKGFENNITGTTGGVVIGDRTFELNNQFEYCYDLSKEWKDFTGLPFVFACWVANKEIPADFITSFNDALKYGIDNRNKMIDEMLLNGNYKYDVRDYLMNKISFDLTIEKKKALDLFLTFIKNKLESKVKELELKLAAAKTDQEWLKILDMSLVSNSDSQIFPKEYLSIWQIAYEKAVKVGDDLMQLHSLYYISYCHYLLTNYDKAIFFANKAVFLFSDSMLDEKSAWLAGFYSLIGLVNYRLGNFEQSIYYHTKGLQLVESDIGKINTDGHGACLNNLALVYFDLKDYDQSLKYYSQAINIYRLTNSSLELAILNVGLASIYLAKNEIDKAEQYINEAIQMDNKTNLRFYASCLNRLAEISVKKKEYEAAKNYLLESIDLSEKGNNNTNLLRAYIEMGNIYFITNEIENALFYINKAADLEIISNNPQIRIEIIKMNALIHEQLGDFKKAYEYYKEYHELNDKIFGQEQANKIQKLREEALEKEKELERIKNVELKSAYHQIAEKSKEIQDSIHYAKRIQTSIFPKNEALKEWVKQSFILFKPKDIVSGDFYRFKKIENKIIIAIADCTGHGVPGAMMSSIGINALNKIVNENLLSPDKILNQLHKEIQLVLKQTDSDSESRDGMDIALLVLSENSLEYAGANRSLWMIKNNELLEVKADKQPIGGLSMEVERLFTNHIIKIEPGDCFYAFSDGYADQFGGNDNKKFMTKRLKELLLSIANQSFCNQEKALDKAIEHWRNGQEQTDDILVIGLKPL